MYENPLTPEASLQHWRRMLERCKAQHERRASQYEIMLARVHKPKVHETIALRYDQWKVTRDHELEAINSETTRLEVQIMALADQERTQPAAEPEPPKQAAPESSIVESARSRLWHSWDELKAPKDPEKKSTRPG